MKSIKRYIIFLILSALIFSCEDFINEYPTGEFTAEADLETQKQGDALKVGAYEPLADWIGGAADWGNRLFNVFEWWSGLVKSTNPHAQGWKWETDEITGGLLDDFNNYWNNQYTGVRNCNTSLEIIPKLVEMTNTQMSEALGEVSALRAFYYFNLVRYFGDVVMVTEPVNNPDEFEQPRTSLKTIYDEVIIPDLEFALENVSEGKSNGWVTKDVVRAILADVYLTTAGYPYQEVATNPDNNWCTEGLWSQDAYPVNSADAINKLNKAKNLLDNLYGKYSLFKSYDALRDPSYDFGDEYIFQISMTGGIQDMGSTINVTLPISSKISYSGENGSAVPTIGYYNSFDNNDLRKQKFFFKEDYIATLWNPANPPFIADDWHCKKLYDETYIKTSSPSDLNWTFYRYADILLMLTEVNWTLRQLGESVSDQDIEKGINEVRARALLPNYSAVSLTLFDIMSERAYELIFENKLTWDQRRTRRCLTTGDGSFSSLESFFGHRPDRYNYTFSAKHLLAPIGDEEIKYNAKMQQNYGYQPTQPR